MKFSFGVLIYVAFLACVINAELALKRGATFNTPSETEFDAEKRNLKAVNAPNSVDIEKRNLKEVNAPNSVDIEKRNLKAVNAPNSVDIEKRNLNPLDREIDTEKRGIDFTTFNKGSDKTVRSLLNKDFDKAENVERSIRLDSETLKNRRALKEVNAQNSIDVQKRGNFETDLDKRTVVQKEKRSSKAIDEPISANIEKRTNFEKQVTTDVEKRGIEVNTNELKRSDKNVRELTVKAFEKDNVKRVIGGLKGVRGVNGERSVNEFHGLEKKGVKSTFETDNNVEKRSDKTFKELNKNTVRSVKAEQIKVNRN